MSRKIVGSTRRLADVGGGWFNSRPLSRGGNAKAEEQEWKAVAKE
jgi:hypothetical protein